MSTASNPRSGTPVGPHFRFLSERQLGPLASYYWLGIMPLRAYAADWRDFTAWCARVTGLPASPESVTVYFTSAAETRQVSNQTRRAVTISHAHQLAGFDSPTQHITVRKLMAGSAAPRGARELASGPS